MATKASNKDTENVAVENTENNKDEEIKSLHSEVDELKKLIAGMQKTIEQSQNNDNNNSIGDVKIINPTLKMDKPCTLIHLLECPKELPTVIYVNNIPQYFSRFGETRTFRFADMQNILSKYRSFFERGVFTLGDDCEEFKDEIGADYIKNGMSINTFKKLESISNPEFDKLIKNLNETQRVHVAQTWIQRYSEKKPGYNNVDKIRILNKYTKDKELFKRGMLDKLLDEVE